MRIMLAILVDTFSNALRVIFSENRESEDTHKKIDFSFISPKHTF